MRAQDTAQVGKSSAGGQGGFNKIWLAWGLLLALIGGANAGDLLDHKSADDYYAWKTEENSRKSFSNSQWSVFESQSRGRTSPSLEDFKGFDDFDEHRQPSRRSGTTTPRQRPSWPRKVPETRPAPEAPRRFPDSRPGRPEPVDNERSAPAEESTPSEAEQLQTRITRRYQDPDVVRFIQSLPPQQALSLYREVSELIDSRHLTPAAYDRRVNQALVNLKAALDNSAFRQANRWNGSPEQVSTFRRWLDEWNSREMVRSRADAIRVLQQTMSYSQQRLGLNPATVVLEFVYGATESLDKYSSFLPPEKQGGPSATLDDHVVGIGVEIKSHELGLEILKVLPGGPAAQARLQAGDLILAIDGRELAGQSLEQSVDLITGPVGSRIVLTVSRSEQQMTLTMTRRSVRVSSVTDVHIVDEDKQVGYLKLERFATSSARELEEALWKLHRQGMQSLILDLRGNPGGLLTTAVEVADLFLPRGTIVSTRGRTPADNMQESASLSQTWKVPLVVLVDQESASASEILAAAIQDNGRGVVVGRKSFGKGTVQTQFGLQTVSGSLKLTTAKFYSPSGREIAGSGVTPDLVVKVETTTDSSATGIDRDTRAALQVATNPLLKELAASFSPKPAGDFRTEKPNPWLVAGGTAE